MKDIEMLGYEILALISMGEKESVDNIINHLGDGDVTHYINTTYKENMRFSFEESNLVEWDDLLSKHAYITFNSDVSRKMGLRNADEDGLLLMIEIILEEVTERAYK